MKKICITVLSYNGQEELPDCLESLLAQKADGLEFEIHILDNASTDGSWDLLEHFAARDQRVKIYKSQSNLGFTGGHNFLIRQALSDFDYFLPFNQDAKAEDREMLQNLLRESSQLQDRAILQPAIVNLQGEVTGTGSMITYFGLGVPTITFYENSQDELFPVDLTQFAAVMIPKRIIRDVGLLSEIYFAYHEDVDYALRARLKGFKNYVSRQARIIHDQRPGKFKTKKFGMYLAERNRYYYLLSHFSWAVLIAILPILMIQEASIWYFFLANGNLDGKIRANRDVMENWGKLMDYRRETRQMMRSSPNLREFYAIHQGAFDARKLLQDPEISILSKTAFRGLNLLYALYRPVFLLSSYLWP